MGSDKASRRSRSYKTFGWQGINLTVPADWELVYVEGEYEAGYLRLADESVVRMEVRWQSGRQDVSPAETINAYLAKQQKRVSKKGGTLSVQRDLNLASAGGRDLECYRWVAERQAVAMLSRCAQCGRSVHVHLLGSPGESLRGLARTVFASLRDHPEDGTHWWRFFDLEFGSPVDLHLTRKSFATGCIRMLFSRWLTKLEFVRLSLAETLLADKGLAEWFRSFYAKPLKRRWFGIRPALVKGHPGVMLEGKVWLLCNPLRLLGRRRVVRGACWQCENTNRLFICCFDGPETEADKFGLALDGLKCCETA